MLSMDGVNFHSLFHVDPRTFASYEMVAPHAHAGMLTLPPTLGSAVAWVKLRSGTEGIPKPVDVDQTFSLIMEMLPASAA
jgi:hypothetical protein